MAGREVGPILTEMLDALDGIEAATAGKTLQDFQDDWLLKHGVQRGIEIISEAARHLPDELLDHAPEVPWKQTSATCYGTNITRSRIPLSGQS